MQPMKPDPEKRAEEVDSIYLHVCNSGAVISVLDEGHGPTLEIQMRTFGNLESTQKIITTYEGLKAVRDMIDRAMSHTFSPDYIHAATPPRPLSECGLSGQCGGSKPGPCCGSSEN